MKTILNEQSVMNSSNWKMVMRLHWEDSKIWRPGSHSHQVVLHILTKELTCCVCEGTTIGEDPNFLAAEMHRWFHLSTAHSHMMDRMIMRKPFHVVISPYYFMMIITTCSVTCGRTNFVFFTAVWLWDLLFHSTPRNRVACYRRLSPGALPGNRIWSCGGRKWQHWRIHSERRPQCNGVPCRRSGRLWTDPFL